MKWFLSFVPIAVVAGGLGCGHVSRNVPTGRSAPSLPALAQAIAAPPSYTARQAPAIFDRENLYKAIDGMDGEYMSYGCVALALLEWTKLQDPQEKIQAEISDMGTPLGAFGIYSRAHTGDGEFADVGEEAAVSEDAVEFARGQFYVRLMGPLDSRPVLVRMAGTIVAQIPPGPKPEQLVAFLPSEGRVPRSERWIPDTAFGMNFLRNVVAARYRIGEKNVELYVASFPNLPSAQGALNQFREAVKTRSPQSTPGGFPGFSYRDDWLGQVGVFQIERQLAVIVGCEESPAVTALLEKVAAPTPPSASAGNRKKVAQASGP